MHIDKIRVWMCRCGVGEYSTDDPWASSGFGGADVVSASLAQATRGKFRVGMCRCGVGEFHTGEMWTSPGFGGADVASASLAQATRGSKAIQSQARSSG
eukprot:352861-Chlamydomonas_euryale.AAC.2